MVQNQDGRSFATATLSWIELLHPETADTVMTRRHDDESPWTTVYYEAVSGPDDSEDLPIATSVVAIDEESPMANPQQPQEIISSSPRMHQLETNVRAQPWKHSNLADLLVGFGVALSAFLFTIKIELAAILVYTIAAAFYYLADEVFDSTLGMLARSICLLISSVLMVVDPILLTSSLLITELLGGIALIVCSCLGGPKSGQSWHQFIRRTCHLTRWGFRNCHKGWKPERIFPVSMESEMSHLNVVPMTDDVELGSPCQETYRDNIGGNTSGVGCMRSCAGGPSNCSCRINGEESTMISDVTFLQETDERPTIAIAPENVIVEGSDRDQNHDDTIFSKTSRTVSVP